MEQQHIKPYELFGCSYNSSLQDVRKAYYRLAMMIHPDKGGNPDDMCIVHTAYKWIEKQLTAVQERPHCSYEEAQADFDAFIASQTKDNTPPSMTEVLLQSLGVTKEIIIEWTRQYATDIAENESMARWFLQMVARDLEISRLVGPSAGIVINEESGAEDLHQRFLRLVEVLRNSFESSVAGGYGDLMCKSETVADVKPLKSGQLIIYEEQDAYNKTALEMMVPSHDHLPAKLDDYTIPGACDYREAFRELPDEYIANSGELFPKYVEPYGGDLDDQLQNLRLARN